MSRGAALACLIVLVGACSRPRQDAPAAAAPPLAEPALASPPPENPADAALPTAAPSIAAPTAAPPPSSREHCLAPPTVPDVALVPRLAELERWVCDGNPRLQVLSRPGSKTLRMSELQQLGTQLAPALREQLGVEFIAPRSCCGAQGQKEVCLWARLPLCAHPLEHVAQVVATVLSTSVAPDTKVSLLVEHTGHAGPRCRAGDASCEPLPYWSATLRPEVKAAGHVTPAYDPALGREPVNDSERQLSSGTCAHDGECRRFGCGNHCMPWHTPEFAAGCPAFNDLSDAHCGCVSGQCAWFTQVPEAHFRLTPGTPRVSSPGLSPERLQKTLSLGWLERQLRSCYEQHLDRLPLDVILRFQVDGAGRLHSVAIDTPDKARAACVVRAARQLTVSRSELPPKARQEVSWPFTLHLAKPAPPP